LLDADVLDSDLGDSHLFEGNSLHRRGSGCDYRWSVHLGGGYLRRLDRGRGLSRGESAGRTRGRQSPAQTSRDPSKGRGGRRLSRRTFVRRSLGDRSGRSLGQRSRGSID
jgi:hypothetical protein